MSVSSAESKRCRKRDFRALSSAFALLMCFGLLSIANAQDNGPELISVPDINEVQPTPQPTSSTDQSEEKAGGIPTHPVEILQEMRYWLVPFLIASVISVWFAIERVVVLRRTRVIPPNFVGPFLESLRKGKLDDKTALALCEKHDCPIAAVFAHGIYKWGRPSVEVEQAIIDGGERQVGQLRKHLRVLNGVATVTPLLGLLGTVVGMIQAFNDIASAGAMGKADQLAAGIAVALLTTAIGLTIAIPSLIMFMYLSGRVESLVMEMDELSLKVVRLVSAEALVEKAATVPRPRTRTSVPDEKPQTVHT